MSGIDAEASATHFIVPIYVLHKASQVMFWRANIDLTNGTVGDKKMDFLSRNGIPQTMKADEGCHLYMQCGEEITLLDDNDKLTVDLAKLDTHLLLVDSLTNPKTHKVKLGPLGLTAKGDI